MPVKLMRWTLFFLSACGLCSGPALGQSPRAGYPTGAQVKKQIVVELTYNYTQTDYSPPVEFRPLGDKASASLNTPEAAVISYVSAMIAGDWQWFISGWTSDSAKGIEDELRNQGVTHESMVQRWQAFKNGPHQLISRVDTGNYAMITYLAGSPTKLFAVVKNDGGVWHLTNELADDPMLAGGSQVVFDANGKAVIRKTVR
jgi:hypothetical protein